MTEGEDAGVWPGYVAAMAGLVQSLLFVSAILALSLLQVSMLAGKKIDEHLARMAEGTSKAQPRAPEEDKNAPPQRKPVEVAPPVAEPNVLVPQPDAETAVAHEDVAEGQLSLRFVEDQVVLSAQARERLIAEVRRRLALGETQWQAQLEFDGSSSLARRAGYLRLMSARSALLEAGVEPAQLQVRLLESASGRGTAQAQSLKLVPARP